MRREEREVKDVNNDVMRKKIERTIVYDFLKDVTKHANFTNDECYPCFLQPW